MRAPHLFARCSWSGWRFVWPDRRHEGSKLTVVEEEAERAAIPVSDRDRTDAQCRDGVANKAMIALGQRAITRRVKPWQMAKWLRSPSVTRPRRLLAGR